jgi:hemerythrin-like domain-containing protein
MKTTEILVEEHHLILKVLDCLEKCVEETVSTEKLQESPAKNMLDFIHNFADHCHHEKEENILFGHDGISWSASRGRPHWLHVKRA